MCFADATCGDNPTKRRLTTGCAMTFGGGAVMHQSEAQSTTALSSAKAELMAAVTAAKNAKCMRSVLQDLGLPMKDPTPMWEDDQSMIETINANKPTGQSRHIDMCFFAIQGWKEDGHITMKQMPGVINPADDLTKPLGHVLHARHPRHVMGHCKRQLHWSLIWFDPKMINARLFEFQQNLWKDRSCQNLDDKIMRVKPHERDHGAMQCKKLSQPVDNCLFIISILKTKWFETKVSIPITISFSASVAARHCVLQQNHHLCLQKWSQSQLTTFTSLNFKTPLIYFQ